MPPRFCKRGYSVAVPRQNSILPETIFSMNMARIESGRFAANSPDRLAGGSEPTRHICCSHYYIELPERPEFVAA
jgi:hypothetical protein